MSVLQLSDPFIIETAEAYQLRPGLRASILKEMLRSPAHARAVMLTPRQPTAAMELGTAVHSAILEPDTFNRYMVAPKFDRRTREGKAKAEQFEADHPNAVLVTQDVYDTIEGCVRAVYAHDAAKVEVLGRCEMSVTWEEQGILCKARPDVYRDGVVVDVKTTADASSSAFARQVANLKYHVQAYHYLRGVTAVTGVQHETFRVVAVETKAPFAVAVYELDFGTLEKAAELWQHAVDLYRQCDALNEWPAYPATVQPLAIPAWAFNELEGQL